MNGTWDEIRKYNEMTDTEKMKAWRTGCQVCIAFLVMCIILNVLFYHTITVGAGKIKTYEDALVRAGEKLDAYEQERREIIKILKEMTEEQQKASSLDNALKTLFGLMGK